MSPELVLIPTISILPDRINMFKQVEWYPYRKPGWADLGHMLLRDGHRI